MPTEYKKSPVSHFNEWFEDAKRSESVLPEAMSVASVGPDGRPSTRRRTAIWADTSNRHGLRQNGF